jgi:excisionase family DNA binding protein
MTTLEDLVDEIFRPIIKNCFRESIDEMKSLSAPIDKPDKCTITEAEEVTGLKKSAIYKKTMKGDIPFRKFGRRLVFSRKELQVWIDSQTIRKPGNEEVISKQLQSIAIKRNKLHK